MRGGTCTPRRSTRRALRSRRPAPARISRALRLLRLVVLACTLQIWGGAHALVAMVRGADAECIDICAGPGNDEPDGHHCPPDCPNCSCPHGRLPSLPRSLAPLLPERLAWKLPQPVTPYETGVPPSPPLPALDRPPRA